MLSAPAEEPLRLIEVLPSTIAHPKQAVTPSIQFRNAIVLSTTSQAVSEPKMKRFNGDVLCGSRVEWVDNLRRLDGPI